MPSGGLPEASGALVVEAFGGPGGGATAVLQCPAGQRRLVHSVNFLFTTDANVAARWLVIGRTIATTIYQGSRAWQSQAASTVNQYIFDISAAFGVIGSWPAGVNATQFNILPAHFWWYDAVPICLLSANIQAGDQITDIVVLYERWLAN
jgi:hypothetical protein